MNRTENSPNGSPEGRPTHISMHEATPRQLSRCMELPTYLDATYQSLLMRGSKVRFVSRKLISARCISAHGAPTRISICGTPKISLCICMEFTAHSSDTPSRDHDGVSALESAVHLGRLPRPHDLHVSC